MDWKITMPIITTTHPCLERVSSYALKNLGNEIDLKDLAKSANVSQFYLCRLFKELLGLSPIKWLWLQRTLAAGAYLAKNINYTLTDIAFACGFSSSAHFSRQFKSVYGVTPSKYKKNIENRTPEDKTSMFVIPPMLNLSNLSFVSYNSY